MTHLIDQVKIFDGGLDNNDNNDVEKSKTVYTYDNYGTGMTDYDLTSLNYPPNHDSTFGASNTARGNVTAVQTWSNIQADQSTTRTMKYDIFGNTLQIDVSCCNVKYFDFSSLTHYSQPNWVRDGGSTAPNLTTNYIYDFHTELVTRTTNPDGFNSDYQYDSAWRLATINLPTGATISTSFERDALGNDQLVYAEKKSYTDAAVSKVITTKTWFDGAGRVIKEGVGAGTSPTAFDTVAMKYDSLGRVKKRTNPYAGDSNGNGTGECQAGGSPSLCWTTNTYDSQSRILNVVLPDGQSISTVYISATSSTGPTTEVTDQVGRKRKSELDGLGRLVKVSEQNPATGALDWHTTYTYDVLNNLKQSNQGGQLRTFVYDDLSRLTSETTPEAGATAYTYTAFDEVHTRTDSRGAITTYGYDTLNRMRTISYNTASAPGVAGTPGVTVDYKQTSPGKGR